MLKSIDVLIGLTVVMLMMSMAVTVLTQFVNGVVNSRGRHLMQGLTDMIHQMDPDMGPDHAQAIAQQILLHPLIRSGTSLLRLAPAFGTVIHREELTKMLMALASPDAAKAVPAAVTDALRGLLQKNGITDPDATLKNVRQAALELEKVHPELAHDVRQNMALMQEAGSDLVAKINSWFDQTVDRVSERFTASTRVVTFACAVVVAAAVQLDTLAVVNRLAMDDALRDSLVAEAQKIDASRSASGNAAASASSQQPPAGPTGAAAQQPSPASAKPSTSAAAGGDQQTTKEYREFLESRGLISIPKSPPEWAANWRLVNPFGVLISVFLLSLGAPFWYNALKNLLALRSTIAAKDDAQRSQRQSNEADQSQAAAAGSTTATAPEAAALVGERGDLNAAG